MLNEQEGQKVGLRTAKNINQPHHCTGSHKWNSQTTAGSSMGTPVTRKHLQALAHLRGSKSIQTLSDQGFFSSFYQLHDSSDPPPNDKVLTDFKRTQQDWAEKELKKEMSSESLVGGEKNRIVSSLQLLLL